MLNNKMNFFFVADLDSGIYREYKKCQAEIAKRDPGLRPPAPYFFLRKSRLEGNDYYFDTMTHCVVAP